MDISKTWSEKNFKKFGNYHIYQLLRSGRSIFKRSLKGLNSEFSFSYTSCLIKAEEPSLPYYLLIAGGRIIGFIPLPRVLVLCEMQSVRSRIWTRVAVFISCDDNHYTTGTSIWELSDELLNKIWSVNKYCIDSVYVLFKDSLLFLLMVDVRI